MRLRERAMARDMNLARDIDAEAGEREPWCVVVGGGDIVALCVESRYRTLLCMYTSSLMS